jgi:hypothetical protein
MKKQLRLYVFAHARFVLLTRNCGNKYPEYELVERTKGKAAPIVSPRRVQ